MIYSTGNGMYVFLAIIGGDDMSCSMITG